MASYKRAGTNLYDLVDRFLNDGFSVNTPLKNIILDVQEFDDKYVIEADVPGVDKKDIHVTFNNDYLKISLESSDEREEQAEPETSSQQATHASPLKTEESEAGDTTTTTSSTGSTSKQAGEEQAEKKSAGKTEKKQMEADDDSHYIHRERMYATVNRVIYLKGATSKGIKAELKDGVLTLVVPKREDAMNQNQTIEID